MKNQIRFYALVNTVTRTHRQAAEDLQALMNWASTPERVARLIKAMREEMHRCETLEEVANARK